MKNKLSEQNSLRGSNFENVFNKKRMELEKEDLRPFYKVSLHLTDESKEVINKMIDEIDITNKPTNKVYEMYESLCDSINIGCMSQIGFSRYIVRNFDYVIVDKKVNGKKYRIFVLGSSDGSRLTANLEPVKPK